MGQIVSTAAKPKRCNKNQLSQLGVLAAGLHVLVSSDNSMNAAGQGNFDCYIEGDGTKAATELDLVKINKEENERLDALDLAVFGEPSEDIEIDIQTTAGSAVPTSPRHPCVLQANRTYTLVYTGTASQITIYFRDSSDSLVGVYVDDGVSTKTQESFTPSNNTKTIRPSQKVSLVNFYASAANVKNTETVKFEFTWQSTSMSLEQRVQTLESETTRLVGEIDNKVIEKIGKNLFNKNSITTGFYIAYNGNLVSNSSCAVSDFIKIESGTNYHLSNSEDGNVGGSGRYINFYNNSKEIVSTIADANQFTTPANAAYVVFTIGDYTTALDDDIQLEKGTLRTAFLEYNEIGGYLSEYVTKEEQKIDFKEKVSVRLGKNLYNSGTNTSGKYFNTSGTISDNNNYNISDFIPVEPSTTYCISDNTDSSVGSSSACHVLYDTNRTKLSVVTGNNKTITTTSGTAYIRISLLASKTGIQVEKGSERTSYEQYSDIGGYPTILQNNSVGFNALDEDVKAAINSIAPVAFDSFRGHATLQQDGAIYLAQNHVIKNTLLSAKINGSIEAVSVGVGYLPDSNDYRGYQSHWITLTPSEVKLYNYYNDGWVLANTYSHGLTLTNNTIISVDTTIYTSQLSILRIFDDLGHVFQQTLPSWGMGRPFATNDGTSQLNVDLSFFARDIAHDIWCFGDSYFNFLYDTKWTYHALQAGMTKWLSNNQPGLSPSSGLDDLESLISLGFRPSFLVWCLGMNGPTTETQEGGQYVINSTQKSIIDAVISICQNNNITPVFTTIPTVPTRQKTGYCNYIRSLGTRYIDFAKAVGADSNGNWNAGLISDDGVHTTAAGAKVLFSQVLVDFPEIAIVE